MVVALAAASGPLYAAREAKPPSHEFSAKPYYILAIAKATAIAGRAVEFDILQRLSGDSTDENSVVLEFDDQTAAQLGVGVRYIVGYTRFAKAKFPNPDGLVEVKPKVLRSLAGGEAICAASPLATQVLTRRVEKQYHDNPEGHLSALLEAMTLDRHLARLAGAEILSRDELTAGWTEEHQAEVQKILQNTDFDPAARTLLLDAGRAGGLTDSQLAETVRFILSETPMAILAGDIYWPNLIRAAIDTLEAGGAPDSSRYLERWLLAPHRGVVNAALAALQKLEPERELTAIHQALRAPFMDRTARQILQQRLDRLSRS